jgi:hypothetical protein
MRTTVVAWCLIAIFILGMTVVVISKNAAVTPAWATDNLTRKPSCQKGDC